jgi:hypothetical protein
MAKSQSGSDDRAKVKLRIIEFELDGANASVENSIRQLTHALSTRTSAGVPKALASRPSTEAGAAEPTEKDPEEYSEPEIFETEADNNAAAKAPKKTSRVNKPRVPQYLHELDTIGNGGMTFKEFAAAKKPKNNNQRHLVAAFWLKEHGNSETITPDKVYSCYRNVGWPTNLNDWDVNFRQQIQNNRFRRVSPGEYAINPPGEDDVRTMDGAE